MRRIIGGLLRDSDEYLYDIWIIVLCVMHNYAA
jgi:hypothetical protein